MTLEALLDRVDVVMVADVLNKEISGVSSDSRTLRAGELYVAVCGYEHDGHKYIDAAIDKGAACIVCDKAPETAVPNILVEDSRKALAMISATWFGYPSEKLKIVGITGTNGKTTVSSLTKQVIEICSGEKAGLIGTNANMIGDKELHAERTTPGAYEIHELLAMMVSEGCSYVVMEVSSHALEQSRVHGITYEVGVFTNLSQDHLDYHASMEEYAQAKALLFKNSRHAAINIDDEYAQQMVKDASCTISTYAVNDGRADLVAKDIKLFSDRVDFSMLAVGRLSRVKLGIPGLFTVYNALAIISASVLLGFDYERIISALQTCKGVKGRAEVVPTGREYTVLIDYAHTPDALKNILSAARGFSKGRVVTLFGCGGDRDKKKRPLMGEIVAEKSDFVVVTSDNPRTEEPKSIINEILAGMKDTKTPYHMIVNRREAIHWALDNSKPNDVLILAGKGHETYQIFGKEKIHFDEREVVAEHLQAKLADCEG